MANWYGTSRSNYVRVKDVDAALASLEPYNDARKHPTHPDFIMISGEDDGAFNTLNYEDDTELDWSEWAKEHLCEGQVLILMEAGAEKLRYVSGWAAAYSWTGESLTISLEDIYKRIQDEWALDMSQVADCSYQNLPDAFRGEK